MKSDTSVHRLKQDRQQTTSDSNNSCCQSVASSFPSVIVRLSSAKPTEVYDTYWKFAAERQAIFFKRFSRQPAPWTNDPILQRFKFTNAYRASDRVSQYLIQHVIYKGDQSNEEVFFRTLLFRIFNRIETWDLLTTEMDDVVCREYSFERYDEILTKAIAGGTTIFSAAYVMPSGTSSFGESRKHRCFLRLLEQMMKNGVPQKLSDATSMREAFELIRSYPMMGDFLAYQYVTDLNYSTLTNFGEMDFVVPGPGARSGIRKCFSDLGDFSETDIIRLVAERQEKEFARLQLDFQSLWGRHLQLIDCQNLFCEVDKYSRLAHPDVVGIGDRKRIKQVHRASKEHLEYWYPPKWDINECINNNLTPEQLPHQSSCLSAHRELSHVPVSG